MCILKAGCIQCYGSKTGAKSRKSAWKWKLGTRKESGRSGSDLGEKNFRQKVGGYADGKERERGSHTHT